MNSFIRIWGCTGGNASAGPKGNNSHTPCVEVFDGTFSYILDAGSGFVPCVREIGERVAAVMFSHFHPDHRQGLWVSDIIQKPTWRPGLHFVSGDINGWNIDRVLAQETEGEMTPYSLNWEAYKRQAVPSIATVQHGQTLSFDGNMVTFVRVVHGSTQSYSIRFDLKNGKSFVYATDVDVAESMHVLLPLCKGVELLLVDTQYTDQEYFGMKAPRPHSCPQVVADLVRAAGVGKVMTFHHGDYNSKRAIRQIARALSEHLIGTACQVHLASDGKTIEL